MLILAWTHITDQLIFCSYFWMVTSHLQRCNHITITQLTFLLSGSLASCLSWAICLEALSVSWGDTTPFYDFGLFWTVSLPLSYSFFYIYWICILPYLTSSLRVGNNKISQNILKIASLKTLDLSLEVRFMVSKNKKEYLFIYRLFLKNRSAAHISRQWMEKPVCNIYI